MYFWEHGVLFRIRVWPPACPEEIIFTEDVNERRSNRIRRNQAIYVRRNGFFLALTADDLGVRYNMEWIISWSQFSWNVIRSSSCDWLLFVWPWPMMTICSRSSVTRNRQSRGNTRSHRNFHSSVWRYCIRFPSINVWWTTRNVEDYFEGGTFMSTPAGSLSDRRSRLYSRFSCCYFFFQRFSRQSQHCSLIIEKVLIKGFTRIKA